MTPTVLMFLMSDCDCKIKDTRVLDTRIAYDGRVKIRLRKCNVCKDTFYTEETTNGSEYTRMLELQIEHLKEKIDAKDLKDIV